MRRSCVGMAADERALINVRERGRAHVWRLGRGKLVVVALKNLSVVLIVLVDRR